MDKIQTAFNLRLAVIDSNRRLQNLKLNSLSSFLDSKNQEHEKTVSTIDLLLSQGSPDDLNDTAKLEDITQLQDEKEDKRRREKNLEKPHMCSICGKTFFTTGHLRSHELTHTNSKEFTCNSCGKKFLTKSYLNRHMKSHLNERNYKCKVCEKGFNTSTSLGYHFRLVHSGETNFQCTFCNKGFPLKIQLISHTR